MHYQLHLGDCIESMRAMPDASVDSIVTDPPYELGFMGKGWDSTGIANSVEMWREALRVLKPGGHLLAFSGTRTYHRMVCAIEDAGFEVRDQIGWLYGSGFPKSLDVSKAIDKMDAAEARTARRYRFTTWMHSTGISQPFLRDLFHSLGTFSTRDSCSTQASSYLNHAKQGPAVPPRYVFEVIRPHIAAEVPAWVEQMVDERTVESENFKRREVVGIRGMRDTSEVRIAVTASADDYDPSARREVNITAPATDAARQWQGWGTALKPAWEPICVARKPLIGTVAQNVLAHGTGALNIDGCRVGDTVETWPKSRSFRAGISSGYTEGIEKGATQSTGEAPAGRWPANIIHDGSDEVVGVFPQAPGQQGDITGAEPSSKTKNALGEFAGRAASNARKDGGSAARFFYCAKASKKDRGDTNTHPTVKPTELMRYLCRLVTPPSGVVLDPFMGSGSTGKAAMLEGFRFIGCELSVEYMEIARARIIDALVGDIA